jgi:hypothetical protein
VRSQEIEDDGSATNAVSWRGRSAIGGGVIRVAIAVFHPGFCIESARGILGGDSAADG